MSPKSRKSFFLQHLDLYPSSSNQKRGGDFCKSYAFHLRPYWQASNSTSYKRYRASQNARIKQIYFCYLPIAIKAFTTSQNLAVTCVRRWKSDRLVPKNKHHQKSIKINVKSRWKQNVLGPAFQQAVRCNSGNSTPKKLKDGQILQANQTSCRKEDHGWGQERDKS